MFKSLLRSLFLLVCLLMFIAPLYAQDQRTHTVRRGETLFRIGLRYGCTVAQMVAANNIINPNRIFVGQRLIVPQCRGTTTNFSAPGTPVPTPSSNPATSIPANNTVDPATDNWCYGGRPWGDGRCEPANNPALRDWFWKAGWYMAQVEHGLLSADQVPSEFRSNEASSSPSGTGGTTNNSSGGTGGTVTACTSGNVLQLVNCARAADGKGPLSANGLLDAAALGHANDMVTNGFFSHTGSNGSDVGTRVTAAGYAWSAVGENIASGQTTDLEVFNAWMNSSGHRANILSASYTEMGLARVGNVWVQVFGRP